jgi:hypothetical protein
MQETFLFSYYFFDIASVESMFGYGEWLTRVLVNSHKSIKKNTTDVVSSNIKQGDVYNIM